jgi:signal transduction histidine kinase
MTRDQIAKVFEAFYTTKSKGLGLGMPYAKKVIEEHGGEIGVESRPGEGTLVTVRLPAGAEGA